MSRVKRGVNTRRRHQKMKKAAKGYRGLRSRTFKWAKNATMKAGLRSYTSRRLKKRDFRSLWITRINSACRAMGVKYSRLIDAMTKKDMVVNRKMLSELAVNEPAVFKKIVEEAMK
ncbi:MAG: 50S ribosomal protein L20 [Candidatus Peregrinibacteria bacterium]|nr:50S ribosomal protein L20 [Candidatus Peregrinibacteria bacterium]